MSNSFEDLSNEQIIDLAEGQGYLNTSEHRVVGVYHEVGVGAPLGGGERMVFVGVDQETGQRVEAEYYGGTFGPSIAPASAGFGLFYFDGPPESMGGVSAGTQASSGFSGGTSISTDGSLMYIVGGATTPSANIAVGVTTEVRVDGEIIYDHQRDNASVGAKGRKGRRDERKQEQLEADANQDDERSLSDWMNDWWDWFFKDEAELQEDFDDPRPSPLILDLDGDGIELTALDSSSAHFDLNINGFAELTGWVSPDDALLALDVNGDGIINDGSELFGDQTGHDHGFLALAVHDDNGDGVIDASDAAFSDLVVWQDLNGDGISQSGEMMSLLDAGVASINLNATAVDYDIAGNDVLWEATFTRTDGTTSAVVDAFFATDQVDTVALLPEGFAKGINVNRTRPNRAINLNAANDNHSPSIKPAA